MPQTFEGLTSFTSMDEALTALWAAQDRIKELERQVAAFKTVCSTLGEYFGRLTPVSDEAKSIVSAFDSITAEFSPWE